MNGLDGTTLIRAIRAGHPGYQPDPFVDWDAVAARIVPASPDGLREAAQAVVDALPQPLRIASDGHPVIDTLTARSPQIEALRIALAERGTE